MPNISKRLLRYVLFAIDIYLWIVLFRIMAFSITSWSYNQTTRLWLIVTDPAVQLLHKIIPPLHFEGVIFNELPVMLVLVLILFRKVIFEIFSSP
jgi:uncharacterized protein YggT (Ycf19 family)